MANAGFSAISEREAEVLESLGERLTNAEIAQRLHISIRTVESHVSSLLRKLGATDRRDLLFRAAQAVPLAGATSQAGTHTPRIAGLPVTWTTFVGRAAELNDLSQAVDANRLVTLVGPGGVGKTRLAVAAASQAVSGFEGGAFVDLVPVSAEFVVHAAAAVLGVVERPQHSLEDVLLERLGSMLLVLDNCEHVLDCPLPASF